MIGEIDVGSSDFVGFTPKSSHPNLPPNAI